MVGMPRGQALIINVNEVSEKPPRRGTDIDRDNLKNLLTQLHFQVTVYNDADDLTALVSFFSYTIVFSPGVSVISQGFC